MTVREDGLEAAEVYEAAARRVTEALDRLSRSIEQGTGVTMIRTGDPAVLALYREIQELAQLSRDVVARLTAVTDTAFREMVDRPSVDYDDRNNRSEISGDDENDDAARV
jgi:hypothetical protein